MPALRPLSLASTVRWVHKWIFHANQTTTDADLIVAGGNLPERVCAVRPQTVAPPLERWRVDEVERQCGLKIARLAI
jgi:hypothetical protein